MLRKKTAPKKITSIDLAKRQIPSVERILKLSTLDTCSKRVQAWKTMAADNDSGNIELIFDTWVKHPDFREEFCNRVLKKKNGKSTFLFTMPIAAACLPEFFLRYFPSDEFFYNSFYANKCIEELKDPIHREQMYAYLPGQPVRWYNKYPEAVQFLKNPSLAAMLTAYFSKNNIIHPLLESKHHDLLNMIKSVQLVYPYTAKKDILREVKKLMKQQCTFTNDDILEVSSLYNTTNDCDYES